MEENASYFQHIMLYYFKKGKTATDTQRKIHSLSGEDTVTEGMFQKWFAKFHAGDFMVNDATWLGRPVEVNRDQIETL